MSTREKSLPEKIPEEFQKVISDFIGDISNTFPEYQPIINKWWKLKEYTEITDETEREARIQRDKEQKMKFIFMHCMNVYPERFFDILYQTKDIFSDESTVNTDFLPGISFKYLWTSDITDKTRETIWKYLQLIMISLVGSIQNKDAFGDAAKMFENINEEDFKNKLQETLSNMQNLFNDSSSSETGAKEGEGEGGSSGIGELPSADDIHSHITGMLGGKLGQLAKEIAEETAGHLNMDMDNVTDATGVMQKLFQNPGKLMGLVNNVKDKLESRIKSGDIKESELFSEATEIMQKMKDMPGMDNIQGLLSKLGMSGSIPGLSKNTKIDVNAMETQLNKQTKMAKTRERMKQNIQTKQLQKAMEMASAMAPVSAPQVSEEEILSIFSTGETVEKSLRGAPQPVGKKKKGKK